MASESVRKWRQDSKHLPDCLRDFHDQKDLFRTIEAAYGHSRDKESHCCNIPNSRDAHAYVIDWFLWFMAAHGYTLQRSKVRLEFDNLGETISRTRDAEAQVFVKYLAAKGVGDGL